MATYKIISDLPYTLEERTTASINATKTGKVFHVNDLVEISKIQINAVGYEWGNTPNGWIATKWNGKDRATPVTTPTPTIIKVPFTLEVSGYLPFSGELEKE